ncbi:MAG: formate dehydrogenase accessory protein FdhE [Phycisphaerae bacterium]
MSRPASSGGQDQPSLKALNRRAEAILKARPAYKEMVDFYLTVFRRQIEWRDRLAVHPEEVTAEQARECLRKGVVLCECYDPGIASESLLNLWTEMKEIFRRGNDVLRRAMDKIDDDEKTDGFVSAAWLTEQRPDRGELVADAARQIGVDESVLATLVRAVTFPHWERVAHRWLPPGRLDEWRRFRCPTCGGVPGLVENRAERNGRDGDSPVTRRLMHCPFCGSCWVVPTLTCPACGSTKAGDARYLFTPDEPELRIDFCNSCHHYVKVVDGGKVSGPVHVGLELLTAAHLDVIARDKKLSPLEVCA